MNTIESFLYQRQDSQFNLAFVMLLFATVAIALLTGLVLGVGLLKIAIVVVAPVLLLVLFLLLGRASSVVDMLFLSFMAMLIFIPLVKKVFQFDLSWLLESLLIVAMPLVFWVIYKQRAMTTTLRVALFLYFVFMVFGVLSSIFGRSSGFASIYQLLTNTKIIVLVALGFALTWSGSAEKTYWWIVRWFWFPTLLLVLWQWASPESYSALLQTVSRQGHPIPLFPSRATGSFQHSSFLALYSTVFFLSSLYVALFEKKMGYLAVAALYLFLLIASGQRQELAAAIIVLFAVYTLVKFRANIILHGYTAIVLLVLVVFMGWYLMAENLQDEAYRWGFIGNSVINQPRPLIYLAGIDIASAYFPLGSGLGTFAGAGAEKFDISLHLQYGFGQFKWFYEQNILYDATLPNVLAESGWFGFLLFISSLLLLVAYAAWGLLNSLEKREKTYWSLAFSGLLFGIILLISSPSFQDPGLSLLLVCFLGIAANISKRLSSSS